MRKNLILSALTALSLIPASGAFAQSVQEIRQDNREVREQKYRLREAQATGNRHEARDARHDLREARQERREDWRDYRRAHRDMFHLPRYMAPRGYTYRPVTVGVRLAPVWYGRSYWISDPYRYRLRVVSGPERWIRYGNDVLLVNTRTGRVIEVNPGFFW